METHRRVYYEYIYSKVVEDSVLVPQSVIDKGNMAVRSFVDETVEFEEYEPINESEDVEIKIVISEETE